MSQIHRALLAVCLLAGLVYADSLRNGFALDDVHIIQNNANVHGVKAIPDAVTGPYWPFGAANHGLYRPLTLAMFAVEWDVWRGSPVGYHLVNVVLHVVVTGFLLLFLLAIGSPLGPAVGGAAVFAVHPVHVEAVANVVGRAELLATLFFLGACLVYLKRGFGRTAGATVGVLYLFALLSKEIAVTLPAALVLTHLAMPASTVRDAWEGVKRRWSAYLAMGVGLVVFFLLRLVNIGALLGGGHSPLLWGEPTATRVWTAVRVIPEYLRLMVFPMDLVPDYGPAVIIPETAWARPLVLLGMLTALGMALIVVIAWRRARLVAVGVLWFAGTVLPVSGLLITIEIFLAERILYLPSVGVAVATAGLLALLRVDQPRRRAFAVALLVLWLIGGSIRTWVQIPVWRDTASVHSYLVSNYPENNRAQWIMAERLSQAGRTAEALQHFEIATRLVPGDDNIRIDFGTILFDLQMYDRAAAQFAVANQIRPEAGVGGMYLINSLVAAGREEEAVLAARSVVSFHPDDAIIHHVYARALARSGRLDEARTARQRSLQLERGPSRWAQWIHLAGIEATLGDLAAAGIALDSARAIAPDPGEVPSIAELGAWVEAGATDRIRLW